MNYKKSKIILEKIRLAKRILVNCHRDPDPDSVGSALAMHQVLVKMDKVVDVICPNQLPTTLSFLAGFSDIKRVNFEKFNFNNYDLFIVLDSSSWEMVKGETNIEKPNIFLIVIDHHKTNEKFGQINLVDSKLNSTAEFVYLIFQDWQAKIDKDIATAILCGIIGDTGIFRFPGTTARTFGIVKDLMDKGADKDEIIKNYYSSYNFNQLKFWGEVLDKMEYDTRHKFVWSAMPFSSYEKYSNLEQGRESAANMFAQIVKDTNFGIIMVEDERKKLSVSIRSRNDFDVSKIALALGGGGHRYAAGAKVKGLAFEKAVKKVLEVAKRYARQNRK